MLDHVMRQEDGDGRSRLFRETLAELRDYGLDGISSSGNVTWRAGVHTSSGNVAFMARVRVRQQDSQSVHTPKTKEERSMRVW